MLGLGRMEDMMGEWRMNALLVVFLIFGVIKLLLPLLLNGALQHDWRHHFGDGL